MRNNLKSPLYVYVQTKLKAHNVAFIGGLRSVEALRDLLEISITNCCLSRIKTNNIFLQEAQILLRYYSFPKDKLKLQFIIDRLLNPFIDCCPPQ